MTAPRHVHTFPVDASLTPEEAWHELCVNGLRTTYTDGVLRWANIVCDGHECLRMVDFSGPDPEPDSDDP